MDDKEKILVKELSEEIRLLVKDNFIAKIFETEDGFAMEFLNGQKFIVSVKEN